MFVTVSQTETAVQLTSVARKSSGEIRRWVGRRREMEGKGAGDVTRVCARETGGGGGREGMGVGEGEGE